MTPEESLDEIDDYEGVLDDESESGSRYLDLARRTWGRWTPFHRFPSGDCLALSEDESVVLWQHDLLDGGPYVHGLRLGTTLGEFLRTWARVGWAEPRDWTKVALPERPGLDLTKADWQILPSFSG